MIFSLFLISKLFFTIFFIILQQAPPVFPLLSSSSDKTTTTVMAEQHNTNNDDKTTTTVMAEQHNTNNDGGDGWATILPKKDIRKENNHGNWTSEQPLVVEFIPPTPENTEFEQCLYLLIGLPGAGKSTFARALEGGMPYKFVRVNQDELKTRKNCETAVKSILAGNNNNNNMTSKLANCNPSIIIDRCNFDSKQRSTWLEIAHKAGLSVHVIHFAVPDYECIRRCQSRGTHETVQPKDASRIVGIVKSQFQLPTKSEANSFDSYTTIRNNEEFNDTILMLLNSK